MLVSPTFSSALQLLPFVAGVLGTSPTDCGCFLTNGSAPTYYSKHMFFDFRSLSAFVNVPDAITNSSLAADADSPSDYFRYDNWTNVWDVQTWDNSFGPGQGLSNDGTVHMVNSKSNIYIEKNNDDYPASDTYLTLRTRRLASFQTAAEFQSLESNFQFVSMRMLARTLGSAGAVTGMFTYRDATGKLADVQESDVEILTRGPRNKIQYTNQPSYTEDGGTIPAATRNATTPDWSRWSVHRLDWTPDVVVWYVNGEKVASIEFQTPKEASDLHFSAWSDGGTWSGNMTMNGQAIQQIQWIQVIYNTTDKNLLRRSPNTERRGEGKCKIVCSIDTATTAGQAEILWKSAASSEVFDGIGLGATCLIALVVVGVVWY